MRVGTQLGPDRVKSTLQRWRDAGLAVRVTQLPYDPSSDAGDAAELVREHARMQRLQRGEDGGDNNGGGQDEQQQGGWKQQQSGGGRKLLRLARHG